MARRLSKAGEELRNQHEMLQASLDNSCSQRLNPACWTWAGIVASCYQSYGKHGGTNIETTLKLHQKFLKQLKEHRRISLRLQRLTGKGSHELLLNCGTQQRPKINKVASATSHPRPMKINRPIARNISANSKVVKTMKFTNSNMDSNPVIPPESKSRRRSRSNSRTRNITSKTKKASGSLTVPTTRIINTAKIPKKHSKNLFDVDDYEESYFDYPSDYDDYDYMTSEKSSDVNTPTLEPSTTTTTAPSRARSGFSRTLTRTKAVQDLTDPRLFSGSSTNVRDNGCLKALNKKDIRKDDDDDINSDTENQSSELSEIANRQHVKPTAVGFQLVKTKRNRILRNLIHRVMKKSVKSKTYYVHDGHIYEKKNFY